MATSLLDEDVSITDWRETLPLDPTSPGGSRLALRCMSRTISSRHPLAVQFPGLSSHASATKIQSLAMIGEDELLIVET